MNAQIQAWIDKVPPWVPVVLAVMALAATLYMHRRWRDMGLDPRRAKAVLVPACTVALLGGLAPHVPYAAARLDATSLSQLTAFSLLASVIALVTAMVQSRQLPAAGYGGGRWADLSPTQIYEAPGEIGRPGSSFDSSPEPFGGGIAVSGPVPMTEYQPAGLPDMAARSPTIIQRPSKRQGQLAWLSATSGPHAGQSWPLGDETRLGRGEKDACEVVLSDPAVSGGQHALIRLQQDGDYLLADLASTNGTFVNGERVMRHTLRDKDRITIGTSELVFVQARLTEPGPASKSGEPS